MPHTETRLRIKDKRHLLINGELFVGRLLHSTALSCYRRAFGLVHAGLFKANVVSRSIFLYVFGAEDLAPHILKIPVKARAAQQEADTWAAFAPPAGSEATHHLAGPVELLALEVWGGRVAC